MSRTGLLRTTRGCMTSRTGYQTLRGARRMSLDLRVSNNVGLVLVLVGCWQHRYAITAVDPKFLKAWLMASKQHVASCYL